MKRAEGRDQDSPSPSLGMVDKGVDQTANLRRDWVWASGSGSGPGPEGQASSSSFSLMSYNILADCHVEEDWYPYCPEGHRKMADRHAQVMVEICHHEPDIVCLQEVGPDYFAQQLNAALYSLGYIGAFMNKVQGIQEGVATFYKRERFQMVEERGATFNALLAEECKKAKLSGADQERVKAYAERSQLVLLTKLQDIKTKQTVSVGNTHLLFDDYKNIDIITLQAGLAVNALIKFAGGVDQPHILCGDFNQEPNMTGYQLMHDGKLDSDGKQYIRQYPIKIGDQTKSLLDVFPQCFTHDSALQSAYKAVVGQEVPFSNMEDYLGREWSPDFKTILLPEENADIVPSKRPRKSYFSDPKTYGKTKFIASLDYQWFSRGSLCCQATLEMVDEMQVAPFYACPNEHFPSDHLSICSRYEFTL